MERFVTLLQLLFPKAIIQGTSWEQAWEEEQREIFVRNASFFFPTAAIVYIGHFFLYDLLTGLEPIEYWFAFRMIAALICLGCYLFYKTDHVKSRFYKVPVVFAAIVLCYSQARVTVYHDDVPYLFCFVFVFLAVMVLRSSPLNSALLAAVLLALQFPSLIEAEVSLRMTLSGSMVTLLTCAAIRTAYTSEVENFLLVQERDQSKEQIISMTQEFSNRIRSFIPKVIANRLQDAVDSRGMSVLEASVEVLRPQNKEIACLFSDIRGFTQGSKDLDAFIGNSVLPEVKACSDAIEDYEGIPRKIGDLVFAYFDDQNMDRNVVRAVLSGLKIAKSNLDINETVSKQEIRRYILVASGEAIVGNIGGVDSAVEITALGSSVNFLARLDDATKDPKLSGILQPGDLVLSAETKTILSRYTCEEFFLKVDLRSLKIAIRDFPEVRDIFVLRPSQSIFRELSEVYLNI